MDRYSIESDHSSSPPPLGDAELPFYTLLVPLFRETSVLAQLIAARCRLDYRALCIKRTKPGDGRCIGAHPRADGNPQP